MLTCVSAAYQESICRGLFVYYSVHRFYDIFYYTNSGFVPGNVTLTVQIESLSSYLLDLLCIHRMTGLVLAHSGMGT